MKKELILPIAIIGLTIAFGVICFLVYITGGTPSLIKKKMRIGALLLTFNAIVWGANAQDEEASCYLTPELHFHRILIGADIGYERNLYSNFPQHITEYSPVQSGTSLTGNGLHFGLSFDYLFDYIYVREPRHSLICNIYYKHIDGINSKNIDDNTYFNQILYGTGLNTNINFQNEFSMDLIGINIFYNYKFYRNLSFGIGAQLEYRLADNYNEKISLSSWDLVHIRTDLPGVKTDAKAQTAILYDDKFKEINTVQLGIPFEFRYDIIFHKFDIIPYIGYNYNFTKWIGNWRTDCFYIGVKLRLTKKDYI